MRSAVNAYCVTPFAKIHPMALDTLAKRLKWARERDGRYKSPTDAAKAFGWTTSTYLGHENGDRTGARLPTIKRYAKAYKVRWEWLLDGTGQPHTKGSAVPLEGYVGAGAEFIPFDGDPGLGDAPAAIEPNSSAVIVRGVSMYPRYFDGEYLYFLNEMRDPSDFIGRECVVKLHDGRRFVKILRRGSKKGLFNLESWNAPMIEDQEVEWAAPVTWRRG